MKFYRCDICGKEIDKKDNLAEYGSERKYANSGSFGWVLSNKDICGKCISAGKKMDFEKVILDAWRNAVVEEAEPVLQENVVCPNCGNVMKQEKAFICTSYPPKHKYTCDNCGQVEYRTVSNYYEVSE